MEYIFQHMNELSDTELRVVMVICYHTSVLSVADIQTFTGRGRQVYDAIKSLKRREIISQSNPQILDGVTKWKWSCIWNESRSVEVTSPIIVRETPKKAKKPSTTNPNQHHLAVIAYTECTHRRPKQLIADVIASAVSESETDIAFWKQVVTAWVLQGWNPQNVDGMLNMYRNKTLPSTTAKRKVNLNPPEVSVEEQERRLADYLRENS